MTGIIWNITPSTTTIAADSRWWDAVANAPGALVGKLYPLPAFNAVLAGGTWAGMVQRVISDLTGRGFEGADDLRARLPGIIRGSWEEFCDEAEHHGLTEPDLCVFWLCTAGRAWLLGNDNGFEPIALPQGLWADPPVADDGASQVREPFRGDKHLVDLMRLQREDREKPSGYNIGGPVTRATITRDGIALAHICDLESDAERSEPARKVGRNEPCPCGSGRKSKRCCTA